MKFKRIFFKKIIPHWKNITFFLCEYRVYILKGFKSHIEKILCYHFKLKYSNQKVFYPTLKKHNFFLVWT
jgi:hypothetical protein